MTLRAAPIRIGRAGRFCRHSRPKERFKNKQFGWGELMYAAFRSSATPTWPYPNANGCSSLPRTASTVGTNPSVIIHPGMRDHGTPLGHGDLAQGLGFQFESVKNCMPLIAEATSCSLTPRRSCHRLALATAAWPRPVVRP